MQEAVGADHRMATQAVVLFVPAVVGLLEAGAVYLNHRVVRHGRICNAFHKYRAVARPGDLDLYSVNESPNGTTAPKPSGRVHVSVVFDASASHEVRNKRLNPVTPTRVQVRQDVVEDARYGRLRPADEMLQRCQVLK